MTLGLLICPCGSRRPPEVWRPKGRRSHQFSLRCPTCGFLGGSSFRDETVRERWNEAVQKALQDEPPPAGWPGGYQGRWR
jgi:hypothetical protein